MQLALADAAMTRAAGRLPFWPFLDPWARRSAGQDFRQIMLPRLLPAQSAWRFRKNLADADLVIANGSGLLADHLRRYAPGRLLALYAAARSNVPVALVNFSFALLNSEDLRALAREVLPRLACHITRESASRDALIELGVPPERITVSADAAFYDCPLAVSMRPGRRLGIQIRGDRPVDIGVWLELIKWLKARHNVETHYLEGCRLRDPPIRDALNKAGALDDGAETHDLDTLRQAIGACDLLLTDRYHGIVFAVQAGTPFLPVASTTLKTAGLLRDIDYPSLILPPLTQERLAAWKQAIDDAFACRDDLAAHLQGRATALARQVETDYRQALTPLVRDDRRMLS